jgi:hypothetical protein
MPPTSNLSRRLSPNAHFKFSLQVMFKFHSFQVTKWNFSQVTNLILDPPEVALSRP